MIAGIRPSLFKFTILMIISQSEILFFHIAEPSCGTAFGKPHMNYKSSKEVIPPAIITF